MVKRYSIVLSVLIAVAFTATAHAQQRRFVSGTGSDANPCSLPAPCRTFTAAVAAVAADGEVVVLDPAGYGAFTVTKGVKITVPPGLYAGITAFSGNGITVNAGPTDVIVLRGLTINGLDLGDTDITDEGLAHLKGLTNLKSLNLRGTDVSDEAVDKLREALPNCRIAFP